MAQYSLHPKIKRYLSLSPDKKLEEIWPFVQRGLVYTSPYAIYASFWLKDYEDSISNKSFPKTKKGCPISDSML